MLERIEAARDVTIQYLSSPAGTRTRNGYPEGLEGEKIPVEGRIMAVALSAQCRRRHLRLNR